MKELIVKSKKFKNLSEIFETEQKLSIIAGPCSIESYEQMDFIAKNIVKNKVNFIRGGAFKPRTSPYDFQGMELDGLKILDDIRKKYNLFAISEIMDPRDIENGIKYTDIIQIGSRNMQNYALLKEVGKTQHPVLIKRGMMSTIEELIYAAEYVASNGNQNIVLCERGIRTYEKSTRNTLDVSCIVIIKKETKLPIIADLSHSLGRKDIIIPIAKSVIASGADGIMVEVHNNPKEALSDKEQQLNFGEFTNLIASII